MNPNFVRVVGASIALLWCRDLAAAHLPVVVQLRQDVPELDENALRDAVAGELGEPVLLEKDATAPSVTVTVEVHRDVGELVVERRDATGTLVRRVPLPADPAQTMRSAVFLVGNLARDEASELLGELRPAPTPEATTRPEGPPPAKVEEPPAESPSLWIGVSAEADLVFLPAGNDVCVLDAATGSPVNGAGYTCADPSTGVSFPASLTVDREIAQGSADQVAGGLKASNVRFLASLDYALSHNVLFGPRVGYVLRTDPSPTFGRWHLEGRLTYAIGHDALTREGLAPILLVGIGAGEFDAYVPVDVAVVTPAGRDPSRDGERVADGGTALRDRGRRSARAVRTQDRVDRGAEVHGRVRRQRGIPARDRAGSGGGARVLSRSGRSAYALRLSDRAEEPAPRPDLREALSPRTSSSRFPRTAAEAGFCPVTRFRSSTM